MTVEVFQDGVIAFFCAVGIAAVVWLVCGAVRMAEGPGVPGVLVVLPVEGHAPALEADVRTLRQVLSALPGAKLVIADCGLTPEARGLAEYLAARERGAAVTEGLDLR